MNPIFKIRHGLAISAVLLVPLAQAASMTAADYKAAKTRISADYKVDKEACAAMKDNAKDICVEQAKAKERVAKAELEYGHTGKPADQTRVLVAKAESTYAVAKEKCDDMTGNAKDVCVKEAKAVEVKALADAKMGRKISDARVDAADDKRDADYKVALQKCDGMAGDAKTSCVAAAKATFGKS